MPDLSDVQDFGPARGLSGTFFKHHYLLFNKISGELHAAATTGTQAQLLCELLNIPDTAVNSFLHLG